MGNIFDLLHYCIQSATYQTVRYNSPEVHNVNILKNENLKFHIFLEKYFVN